MASGRRGRLLPLGLVLVVLLGACSGGSGDGQTETASTDDSGSEGEFRRERLAGVDSWLYMIDVNLDGDTVDQIADSDHDLVVIDFITSEAENTDYPLADVIDQLHEAGRPKTVLAYLDVGQAEEYRTYWQDGWEIGDPDWLVGLDPDGWEGNFPVAYWREEWSQIWLDDGGYIDQVVEAGFDGVYLDWVEAYDDENVTAAANDDGVDPVAEMADWVGAIAEHGRTYDPGFLVVGQNAAELVENSEQYRTSIDAVAQEQVWFDGGADNDPPGDCPLPATDDEIDSDDYVASLDGGCLALWQDFPESTLHVSSQEYLTALAIVDDYGLPVFTVDYAVEPDNVEFVLEESRRRGFTPFVGVRWLNEFVSPR